MKIVHTIAIVSLLMSQAVSAAGDAAAGKEKSLVCKACHGANGIAIIPGYPNLAGQNEQYLVSSMKDYRDGRRTGTMAQMMAVQSTNLTDQDIADLAAYYAQMKN